MDLKILENLMSKNIIKEIPSLVHYIPNFITEEEENSIIYEVNNAPLPKWTQLSHRRLQNYGGIPHVNGMIAEKIPKWLEVQINKIALLTVFNIKNRPNHVLINEYLPGQGIMAHSDGPLFHPIVTTISCGSHTLLKFHKLNKMDNFEFLKYKFSLLLEPRSLLILQSDMYQHYLHSIDERTTDIISTENIKNLYMCSQIYKESQILQRSTRISLTIRHVPRTSKLKLKFRK